MKESESEEHEGFGRRSVQSHRQSRQKEKSSDIEEEISENYRLAEEYLNKYVGASETSKRSSQKVMAEDMIPGGGRHFNFACMGVCGHRIRKLTHSQTEAGPSINKNTPILRLFTTEID